MSLVGIATIDGWEAGFSECRSSGRVSELVVGQTVKCFLPGHAQVIVRDRYQAFKFSIAFAVALGEAARQLACSRA